MEQNASRAHSWRLVRFRTCVHLILTLHVGLLLSATAAAQDGNVSEVQTLLKFKKSSIDYIGPWRILPSMLWQGWNESDEKPCAWAGVACDAHSLVYGLDFSGWGLSLSAGDVAVLSELANLRRLDLSLSVSRLSQLKSQHWQDLPENPCNGWSNTIPENIGILTKLTNLDLSGNCCAGKIPRNISACENLQDLSLHDNLLAGGMSALAGMTRLRTLYLANNRLSGSFPDLRELPGLVAMDLSNNGFTGPVPDISTFPALEVLMLDNNDFSRLEDSFFKNAERMRELSIAGNRLNGSFQHMAGKMPNIQVLNLSSNYLSGEIPSEIRTKNPISWESFRLDLSRNLFNGSIPTNLIAHPNASSVTINLSHNRLTGNISSILEQFPPGILGVNDYNNVIFLDLSHNEFSGLVPSFSSVIYDNTVYRQFNINDNQLFGDIVDVLVGGNQGYSGDFLEMHLQNNRFTGDMSRLVAISKPLSWFWNLNLTVLDLSNNCLTWSSLEDVLDPLSVLLDRLNEFSMMLRIGKNNFSGISLPAALSPGSALTGLDLSNNYLIGQISGAAFHEVSLPFLQVFDVSNNHATGPIPPEIASLPLTAFDFSNNFFRGSLAFIQPGSPLYYPSSFAGNGGLCDGPLASCRHSGWPRWLVYTIVAVSVTMAMGSFLVAVWWWRVYKKRYQEEVELIRSLLDGESATVMSLSELKRATNNFAESTEIGEGGFGKVYKGELSDGTVVAIKRSKRQGLEKEREQFLNEVRILTQLNHRYLVKLLGCCLENKVAVLVFEFISNGTLQEHLQQQCGKAHLFWKQRLNIAVQTADALNYLHSAATVPIYHRDVKSANILLDHALNAKVADFGISKLVPGEVTHDSTIAIHGTMGYIDPDYFTSFKFNDKSDVYSFGVVLLELISAKPAIDFKRPEEESSLVIYAKPYIERGDLEGLIDPTLLDTYDEQTQQGRESILSVGRLAVRCSNMRSRLRPSMQEVLKELQNLLCLLALDGSSVQLEGIDEDGTEDQRSDVIDVPSESLSRDKRWSWPFSDKSRGIEMSGFSR